MGRADAADATGHNHLELGSRFGRLLLSLVIASFALAQIGAVERRLSLPPGGANDGRYNLFGIDGLAVFDGTLERSKSLKKVPSRMFSPFINGSITIMNRSLIQLDF